MPEKTTSEMYIDEIVKNLKEGHAAAFVGAGFSKNADKIDGTANRLPDWIQLSDMFCEKLAIYDDKDNKGNNSCKYLSTLTLAQEVEEMYGKSYLNNLLKNIMDDDSYRPGIAHKDLMNLPWNDVFTTNYDTLLEKAFQAGTIRRYHVIYNQQDLLYSAHEPRLIKLHGSFPSYEPFIISEEDFRRYPIDYAPFVNTVQQALLENVFVLFGFSGDDPNFLKWIGWIHDNLGLKNSPRIYMVCKDALPTVKTHMLAAKNIDLVVLDDVETYRRMNYRGAIEAFLRDLNKAVDNRSRKWSLFCGHGSANSAESAYTNLKHIHDTYPGWILARYKDFVNLRFVIQDVDIFISKFGTKSDKFQLELELCDEYCWLCGVSGYPIKHHVLTNIIRILEKNDERHNDDIYSRIQLSILRSVRIEGDDTKWNEIYADLSSKLKDKGTTNDLYAGLIYEKAMYLLYMYKWDQLEEVVRRIPTTLEHGEWSFRKAGLMALLGYYDEAMKLLNDAREYARRVLMTISKDNVVSYNRYASIENCIYYLANFIMQAQRETLTEDYRKKSENSENSFDTANLLKPYTSNVEDDFLWDVENEKYCGRLSDNYRPRAYTEKVYTFDIGEFTNISHFGSDGEAETAMQYAYFREMTSLPYRLGIVTNKNGIIGTVSRIKWENPYYAAFLSIMACDKKAIKVALNRATSSIMTQEQVDDILSKFITLMRYGIKVRNTREHTSEFDSIVSESVIEVIPEAISMLCSKCSADMLSKVADLMVEIYAIRFQFIKAKELARRLILSMPLDVLKINHKKFWDIDIAIEDEFIKRNYPDPFRYVNEVVGAAEDINLTFENGFKEKYLELLNKIDDENYRNSALSRLCFINNIYNVPKSLRNKFVKRIWSEDNLDEYGLPNLGEFYRTNAVLYVDKIHDKEKIMGQCEQYLLTQFNILLGQNAASDDSKLYNMAMFLLQHASIREEQVKAYISLAKKLCEHWASMKDARAVFGFNGSVQSLVRVDEVLGIMILKAGLADANHPATLVGLDDVIKILDDNEVPHSLLSWCSKNKNRYENIIESAFMSEKVSANANRAIYDLIEYGINIEDKLKTMMINSIVTALHFNVNTYAVALEYLVRKQLVSNSECNEIARALIKFDKMTSVIITSDDDESIMSKLAMRKLISMLAHTMYELYVYRNELPPSGVMHWKSISENPEEAAEIRLIWERKIGFS